MIATTPVLRGKRLLRAETFAALLVLAVVVFGSSRANAASGPPQILIQPTDAQGREGEQVAFAVQVDGDPPLTIQWQRNGELISGASEFSLTIGPLSLNDNGDVFSASVANSLGDVTSSPARLTVTPGIVVAASANRAADLTLYRGWPLVLEVTLLHPDAFETNAVPILISATNGPWAGALQIDVRDAVQQPQSWPWHAAPFTNELVRLNSESGGRMLWWLTPEETLQLPLGDFQIMATLNTTNVTRPDAWKGLLGSVPVSLSVTNEPSPRTEAQEEQKRRLSADYALLFSDRVRAQLEIDALLAAYPTNIGGLTYDAYLKEAAGQFDAALQSLEKALDQVAVQSPAAPEPPIELLNKHVELQQMTAPPILAHEILNQQVLLSWFGHPALNYRLETSSDLITWTLVTTNFNITNNRFSYSRDITREHQFFRVLR